LGSPRGVASISPDVFDKLVQQDEFYKFINLYHANFFARLGLRPVMASENRIANACDAFVGEAKRFRGSLPPDSVTPDHFKLSGALVYWLRRFGVVYGLQHQVVSEQPDEDIRLLALEYECELPAYTLGLDLCKFFEHGASDEEYRDVNKPRITMSYLRSVCYLMRFKSLSPHAMGMIYRSLFI